MLLISTPNSAAATYTILALDTGKHRLPPSEKEIVRARHPQLRLEPPDAIGIQGCILQLTSTPLQSPSGVTPLGSLIRDLRY